MTKRLGHLIEYVVVRTAALVFGLLPLPIFYRVVRWLGHIAFDVLRIRRGVTLANLRIALGSEYGDAELIRIARATYENIAITFAEVLIYPRLKPRINGMVDDTGFETIREAVRRGGGAIVVTCHYGSWEFVASVMTAKGIPVTAVGKTQSNPYVDRFLGARRAFMDIGIVARGTQVRQLVQALRGGGAVILVSDQDAGRRGIFAPFFGTQASTPAGAAQLALRYGVPVLIVACERTGDGRYRMIVRELPAGEGDTAEGIVVRMNGALEDIIRRDPGQYLWMHKRWKTRPPGESQNVTEKPAGIMAGTGGTA